MRNFESRIRRIENPLQTGKQYDVTDFAIMAAEQLGLEPPISPVLFSNADIKGVFQELAKLQGV